MTEPQRAKPFIKIPGGKSRMIKTLLQYLPKDFFQKEYKYVEPFLGGGSFGLHLLSKNPSMTTYFNEFNFDIFNVWAEIKEGPDTLATLLTERKDLDSKEFFNDVRSRFLEYSIIEKSGTTLPKGFYQNRAADFVYLNKTCFNGLIRYNKKGKFNSPYGHYEDPTLFDKKNLDTVYALLANTNISNNDFEVCVRNLMQEGELTSSTLVYMDPPYIPESLTSKFTEYTSSGFGLADHNRMRKLVDALDKLGVKFLISNSDTPMTRKIYKGYKISSVYNSRSIGASGDTRGKTKELLIKNY